MALARFLIFLLQICLIRAMHLYVATYGRQNSPGNITTLSLDAKADNSSHSLTHVATLNTATTSPSWLTLHENILYMVDEAINSTTNGTIVSYETSPSGRLTELNRTKAPVGGVDALFFAYGGVLAVPHYTGSMLQTYKVSRKGRLEPLETFNFHSSNFSVGPVAKRQESPHPHQTILDPTGDYMLIPDLGSDQVRIFSIDHKTGKLREREPLKTSPGSGPRHAVFPWQTFGGKYVFYLVTELDSKVIGYNVTYKPSHHEGLTFSKFATYDTIKPSPTIPRNPDGSSKIAPAEITITPDGSTLIVSNRYDTSFGTTPPTDSLVSFAIDQKNGSLKELPLVSAHGSSPRHFALNKDGDLMAVALQESGKVAILRKSSSTGLFEEQVASIKLETGNDTPVCVIWDE